MGHTEVWAESTHSHVVCCSLQRWHIYAPMFYCIPGQQQQIPPIGRRKRREEGRSWRMRAKEKSRQNWRYNLIQLLQHQHQCVCVFDLAGVTGCTSLSQKTVGGWLEQKKQVSEILQDKCSNVTIPKGPQDLRNGRRRKERSWNIQTNLQIWFNLL